MESLVGHMQQRDALAALALGERLPSSLLFVGAAGIGKQRVALELARQLLCLTRPCGPRGGCGSCRACSLVESGNHPDLHRLAFGEDGATLDDLRSTLDSLSLKPYMGGRKVAVINDADQISAIGANTVLKSLEEPRPETFYLLIAENPARLPPTLLSRCQRWFFDRLSSAEVRSILSARGNTVVSEAAALLADGSLARISSLEERADALSEVESVLDGAFRGDERITGRAAQEWGQDKAGLRERFTFLRAAIRQRLLDSASDPAAASVWAVALQNVLDAEYLSVERHVSASLSLLHLLRSCSCARAALYRDTPHSAPPLLDRLQF